MSRIFNIYCILFFFHAATLEAESLTLSSDDITDGKLMSKAQEFNGFGCTGNDLSPHLQWSGTPEGTKSFALTVYDPDAPTGSGWWHWQVINIPKTITEIKTGASKSPEGLMPAGSLQIRNDYGSHTFGGACPPTDHGIHRYKFTIHALSVEKLDLPENASGALTGYMINANTLATSTIESLYKRD